MTYDSHDFGNSKEGDGEENIKQPARYIDWYKVLSTQHLIESGTTGPATDPTTGIIHRELDP